MHRTTYRTVLVEGRSIFYREAGPQDAPSHTEFDYTFDHVAAVIGSFTQAVGLASYTLVVQDYDPDLWTDEFAFLNQPGQQDIQTDLFYDYRTNVASYPAWQHWLREHRPPLQVIWGRYDPSFQVAEAEAYRRDVPDAEVHILDAGHFALDEQPDVIADLTRGFLERRQARTDS